MQVSFQIEGGDEARLVELAKATGASIEETARSIVAAVLDDDARAHAPDKMHKMHMQKSPAAAVEAPPPEKRRGRQPKALDATPAEPEPIASEPKAAPEISKAQIKAIKAFASVGNSAAWIAREVDLPVSLVKSILKGK